MLLSVMALLCPSSSAFAPTAEGLEGREPQRLLHRRAPSQGRLRRGPGWTAFEAGEGAGWQARFDERTGTAHRAWGPGIPLGALPDADAVEAAMLGFLSRNPGLVGVAVSELRLRSAGYVARTDTWYVDFDRLVDGHPLRQAGVTARIRFGKLILLGIDTYPEVRTLGEARVSDVSAQDTAERHGLAPMARHEGAKATLKGVVLQAAGTLDPRLVWEVRSRTLNPPGKWVSLVDARSGELLNTWNEVRFFDGTVSAIHDTRTVDGDFSTSPLRDAYLAGASGATGYSGDDGTFSLDDDDRWTGELRGRWLTVRNDAGAEGQLDVIGSTPTWTSSEATQAEIDSYVFLYHVRDWCLETAPEVDMCTDSLRSNVNLTETCNAYYDGSVNFYEAGDGCNNTGRIADVNYHEWGHGFHYYSLESGAFDGSMGEGIGDVVAFLQTLDETIAPYFGTNGGGIREVSTDYAYPEDVTGEVHQDGLIFAGAVWDLLGLLSDTYGESVDEKGEAWRITSRLLADGIKAGPVIEESYDEFVAADDDDGDLSNGTPHFCEIVEAFGRHGLGPAGTGGGLSIDHAAVGNQGEGAEATLSGAIVNLMPQCAEFTVSAVEAVYSVDGGGSWDTAPLGVAGDAFSGALPAFESGTIVQYYLHAESTEGDEVSLPAGGAIAPYTFYVGGLSEVYCEDFSESDGDYSHALLDGDDIEGADDWIFKRPEGLADDPEEAFTDGEVWGNDLGGGRYNGEYQPNIVNRLTSVPIDVGGAPVVILQYRRWLNVEDGVYDRATVYADDVEVWSNHATTQNRGDEHTEDREWILHTLELAPESDSVEIAWEMASDQGLEFGGWNIDDVCVYVPTAGLFAIADFTASDNAVGEVTLRWTQPANGAATDAIVVRRTDRFPESRDDGDVVYEGPAAAGEAKSAVDPYTGTGYYAVFAGGGDAWLLGARPGYNADEGTGLGGDRGLDSDEGIKLGGGCGCATPSSHGRLPWVAGLLAALALARRRR